MTQPKKLGEAGIREKPTKVANVIDDGTLYIAQGLMQEIAPVLTNEINDIEIIEGICGRVYIGLVAIVRANERIGARTRPDVELEQLANRLKARTPIMV